MKLLSTGIYMAATFKEKIVHYSENIEGIDYVLGDIHGRFDLVYQSLKEVGFNENKDRLFCVGDLIDRGPYSNHVVEFLSRPYVHAVRGNHEDMLLEFYEAYPNASDGEFFQAGYRNGMTWFLKESVSERGKILEALSRLPLVIEIENHRGLVGLVHAEVPANMSWPDFKEQINQGNSHVIETALWGRKRLTHEIQEDIEGLGRLYVGHTVQERVKKLGNVVAIDTGAVFNQHLSMVNIACSTAVLLKPEEAQNNIFNATLSTSRPFSKMK